MVTQYEARKLRQDSKPELNSKAATAWKCGAGLVAIAVLALLGTSNNPERDSGGGARPGAHLESFGTHDAAPAAAGGKDLERPADHLELVRHEP
jgi:hypothetical protein